jgi:hypothetical protein
VQVLLVVDVKSVRCKPKYPENAVKALSGFFGLLSKDGDCSLKIQRVELNELLMENALGV